MHIVEEGVINDAIILLIIQRMLRHSLDKGKREAGILLLWKVSYVKNEKRWGNPNQALQPGSGFLSLHGNVADLSNSIMQHEKCQLSTHPTFH